MHSCGISMKAIFNHKFCKVFSFRIRTVCEYVWECFFPFPSVYFNWVFLTLSCPSERCRVWLVTSSRRKNSNIYIEFVCPRKGRRRWRRNPWRLWPGFDSRALCLYFQKANLNESESVRAKRTSCFASPGTKWRIADTGCWEYQLLLAFKINYLKSIRLEERFSHDVATNYQTGQGFDLNIRLLISALWPSESEGFALCSSRPLSTSNCKPLQSADSAIGFTFDRPLVKHQISLCCHRHMNSNTLNSRNIVATWEEQKLVGF